MKALLFVCQIWILFALVACRVSGPAKTAREAVPEKIRFDLGRLNSEGLQGQADGLRAFHYEYCLLDDPEAARRASEIDPTFERQRGPGRAGCLDGEILALGHTHQKNHREILLNLTALPEVGPIHEAFFE